MDAFTYDIETRHLARDIGGWDAPPGDFGITCVVGWSAATGRPHIYSDLNLGELSTMMEHHHAILSFNGVNFDLPIIEALYGEKVPVKYHLDLLQIIWEATSETGGRHAGYRLTECAERTLGIGKSGDGTLAPQLAEDGKWCELVDYCIQDVVITRKLFLYAQKHGGIIGTNGELLKLNFPDWFPELNL